MESEYTKLCDEAALAGLSRPRLSASETLKDPGLLLCWVSRVGIYLVAENIQEQFKS